MTTNTRSGVKVLTTEQLQAGKLKADEERARIRAEGIEHGLRHANHYKAAAYVFAGFLLGALFTGIYTNAVSERSAFVAGAVIDRVVARTVDPGLPAAPRSMPAEDYQRNTEAARREACRVGVRDPRTGLCPREPGSAPN